MNLLPLRGAQSDTGIQAGQEACTLGTQRKASIVDARIPASFTPVSYSYGLMAIAIGTAAELSAREKPVAQRAELGFWEETPDPSQG